MGSSATNQNTGGGNQAAALGMGQYMPPSSNNSNPGSLNNILTALGSKNNSSMTPMTTGTNTQGTPLGGDATTTEQQSSLGNNTNLSLGTGAAAASQSPNLSGLLSNLGNQGSSSTPTTSTSSVPSPFLSNNYSPLGSSGAGMLQNYALYGMLQNSPFGNALTSTPTSTTT